MTAVDFQSTSCAVCGTEGNATELYPENFDLGAFSPAVFSARRLPDRIHYRIVRCNTCGLVRSDPVADSATIAGLYHQSTFDYSKEVDNLKRTYGAYLARLERYGTTKGSLLEIGCGNGFFLEEARAQGYRETRGVEPSQAAIDCANEEIRTGIVCAMMGPGLFPESSFDVVCLFQVLDHILDPASILENCFKILKPGGFVLCLNHNVEAFSSRIMKARSPIVDIEHTYLYSRRTVAALFSAIGFEVKETGGVRNRYSLKYLTQLLPLPRSFKKSLLRMCDSSGLSRLPLSVPLGNLYLIARKPGSGERRQVDVFDRDAACNDGYQYTHSKRMSCRLATQRTTDIILETGEFEGRSVLDVACGDGFYTMRFWDRGRPARLVAADAAATAVRVAARSSALGPIRFLVADAHRLPFANDSFDVVLLQSVLHHDDAPLNMIQEAFRVGSRIIIHEPNGDNPGLKIIERCSRYHIEHHEKSYTARQARRWIEAAGASVVYEKKAGFVPMFCPDWIARITKTIEPLVERMPLLRPMACAVYVMVGVRENATP